MPVAMGRGAPSAREPPLVGASLECGVAGAGTGAGTIRCPGWAASVRGGGHRRADCGRATVVRGEDLVRRAGVSRAQLETLAAAGALDADEERGSTASGGACCGRPERRRRERRIDRRELWVGAQAPLLPEPTPYDSVGDDLWALGLAPERTAMHLARERPRGVGRRSGRRPLGV